MRKLKHALASVLAGVVGVILVTGFSVQTRADEKTADPNGTWTWTTPGRNGGPDRKSTLKLKAEGEKLTGTMSTPGRQGGDAVNIAIEDGQIKGDAVKFKISREFNGNKFTMNYNGKVSGDSIKGTVEFDRNGETQSRDWEAKREVEKK